MTRIASASLLMNSLGPRHHAKLICFHYYQLYKSFHHARLSSLPKYSSRYTKGLWTEPLSNASARCTASPMEATGSLHASAGHVPRIATILNFLC
ncbi:hypothetical protein V6Z12_D07G134500 [Gossypium hirsutum]